MRQLFFTKIRIAPDIFTLLQKVATILLLVFPLTVYIFAYNYGSCDDKAVHYYSSAYVFSSDEQKQEVHTYVDAKVSQLEEAHAERYIFRLWESPSTYPLTNGLIRVITTFSDVHFSHTVALSLFLTTITGYAIAVFVIRKAGLGLFQQGLLYIFLIFLGLVGPDGMVGFLTFVPRATAMLFVVPLLMFLYRKNYKAAFATSILPFLIHTSFGMLIVGFVGIAYGTYAVFKSRLKIFTHIVHSEWSWLLWYLCVTAAGCIVSFAILQTGFGESLKVRYDWFASLPYRILGIMFPVVSYFVVSLTQLPNSSILQKIIRNLAQGGVIAGIVTTYIVVGSYHVQRAKMYESLTILTDSCAQLVPFESLVDINLYDEARTFYTLGEFIFQK